MEIQNPLEGPRERTRISVFVDGENAYYAQRSLGWFFDPRKLLDFFTQGATIGDAFWYASQKNAARSA